MNETQKENRLIPGTFDPVFKEIFTSPDCHNYSCALISEITGIDLDYLKENLRPINNNIPKKNALEKAKEGDVILSVEGHIINLEMNESYYNGILEKNDLYHHGLMVNSVKRGENYLRTKKVIQINIDNYSLYRKEISKFMIIEETTGEIENENYIKYHIALDRILKRYYNNKEIGYKEKLLVMMGVTKKEDLSKVSKGDKTLMEAKEKLEVLSDDDLFQDFYDKDREEKMIHNTKMKNAELEGLEKGLEKGLEQGKKQGLEQGKRETVLEIAKDMLADNMDISTISKYTGISEEEIMNIK